MTIYTVVAIPLWILELQGTANSVSPNTSSPWFHLQRGALAVVDKPSDAPGISALTCAKSTMSLELCESLNCTLNGNEHQDRLVRDICHSQRCAATISQNLSRCVSNDSVSWASFTVLLAVTATVALFGFKVPLLWTPSRIIRKIRRHRQLDGMPLVTKPAPYVEAFHSPVRQRPHIPRERQLHIVFAKIGKGRHTLASRLFIPALETWWIALEALLIIADPSLSSQLTLFDPLLAFRLKLSLSSLTVLGAWPKSWRSNNDVVWLLMFCARCSSPCSPRLPGWSPLHSRCGRCTNRCFNFIHCLLSWSLYLRVLGGSER